MRRRCVASPALALVLALIGRAAADAPRTADLEDLLRRDPIDASSWARWSPRLRAWSGTDYVPARPAFRKAFDFVLASRPGASGKRPALPKPLDRDAVAWMVLSEACLQDAEATRTPMPAARTAEEAAREAIRRDAGLARAHEILSRAIRRGETTPHEKGGPARPDPGRLREALKELKEAIALDPKVSWMAPGDAGRLALAAHQWDAAASFLRRRVSASPRDVDSARLLAGAIAEQARPSGAPRSAEIEGLIRAFPDDGVLASHLGRALAREEKRDEAATRFALARKLGVDPAAVVDPKLVREVEEDSRRRAAEAARVGAEASRRESESAARERAGRVPGQILNRLGWSALVFALFYGSAMGMMSLAGLALARRTRGPAEAEMLGVEPRLVGPGGRVARTSHESLLARAYGVALGAALVFFYASLPFVFVGMLVVFLGLAALTLVSGRDARASDVHGAFLRASGGGIGALFKATFARTGTGGYGKRKGRDDCPRLFAAIDDVARRVDTEPPDEVYIAPGADFGVHQEGRGPFGVFGGRKRVLTLGLCALHALSVGELKAILAHEFAHFSHADTHWNRFLFQVTLSLRTALREMARTGGWVTYVNPFYWFFWLYSKAYSLLSAGFSRSREFLADRMACVLYGSDAFTAALRKVCTEGALFEATIHGEIARLLGQKKAFVNMYLAFRNPRAGRFTESDRRELDAKLLEEVPSAFGSHPTFAERLAAAGRLPRTTHPEEAPSMSLFEDAEAVERELSDFLTGVTAAHLRLA